MNNILQYKGLIIEKKNRYNFLVYVQEINQTVDVTISQKMVAYESKELNIGDLVLIEISPNDLSRGRVHRYTFSQINP